MGLPIRDVQEEIRIGGSMGVYVLEQEGGERAGFTEREVDIMVTSFVLMELSVSINKESSFSVMIQWR